MKATSIEANNKANKSGLKINHKKKIMKVLTTPMNGKEIAEETGLDYHAVMRRMSELESDNKVKVVGVKNRYSIYMPANQLNIFDLGA
jgi:predicted Rossmann fold nucleotide-binding protein DprA/Smf involved in DNA uptake